MYPSKRNLANFGIQDMMVNMSPADLPLKDHNKNNLKEFKPEQQFGR